VPIHSWELATAVDGPGTRLVIFFQGCRLRCLFCHNPDTWQFTSDNELLSKQVDHEIEEMQGLFRRYQHLFEITGGGITLSGGEVLRQKEEAFTLLKIAKGLSIHTCIDTSGDGVGKLTDQELELLDLVLLDIKAPNAELYQEITGLNIFDEVLNFARRLEQKQIMFRWRFVLVPELNDSDDFLDGIKTVISQFSAPLDILPFHQLGSSKYQDLQFKYRLKNFRAATKEDVDHAESIIY
jgi:pyruvate formate lyase activating enzyme